ncbi:endonuclease/exonuclease/phosphatase family protein [Aestuariispira insulae]|uniref:Endonuclease/exonuclease/phosphatase domain-containing protein n=1 Tax=Aestuariispira insulae TaxID=1461337 RepID=A0A3D9HRE7_9PROT|nr:endonuclease/exonuclease/phosphatase family protein [Aestuariispira insulae]RED52050.1 hypothetical protein DFP90_10267 [Aestuariispira insulae]
MPSPVINEFVLDHSGSDLFEFVEFFGTPDTDYSQYTLIQIEGDASNSVGRIDSVDTLGQTNAEGFFTLDFSSNRFENGTVTLLLVENFTGSVGDMVSLDPDSGAVTGPFSAIADSVAIQDSASDTVFSDVVLGDMGGASRLVDGQDTDSAGDFIENDYGGHGLPGSTDSHDAGTAVNTPNAANSTDGNNGGGDPDFVAIYDIQGLSHQSAYTGQAVKTSGIVTAVDSNGYYLQDASGDGNIGTSDAIFIFTGSAPTVAVGDAVEVSGTVEEYQPGGASSHNLSITQLTNVNGNVLSSGNDLPAAVILGEGGRMAPTDVVEDDAFGSYDPESDGIDFYESLEGMRVTVPDTQVVGATNRYGEIWTVADNGDNATGMHERGGIHLGETDTNPERIQIQIDNTLTPGGSINVNVGDSLGDVTGVMSYSYGNYEILATEALNAAAGLTEQEITSLTGNDDQMTVASYNVLNLDPSDTDQIQAIAQQIVDNLLNPDVLALQEVQDNSGATDDGTVDADQTLQALADAIKALGGPEYQFFDIDPEDKTQGGQPGGNIRVAYLYNPERVTLVEDSVQRLDDPAFDGSRIPLQAQFEFNGETVTVINNHLSSKFGSTPIFGDTQPFINAGEEDRIAQAQAINAAVDAMLDDDPDAKIVVLGDMNDFDFSTPIDHLSGESEDNQVLYNQIQALIDAGDDSVYTYNYQGSSQNLDHLLVSESLRDVTEFDVVHTNVDFADAASDHEPILARITIPKADPMVLVGTRRDDILEGGAADDIILGNKGDDLLIGNGGADYIEGGKGRDDLFGGDGDDTLIGGKGKDLLLGGAGDDLLNGGKGNDTLIGGAGNDILIGGKGRDVYLFGYGDGEDLVVNADRRDIVRFGTGITADQVSFAQDGDNLVASLDGGDSITIADWYAGNRPNLKAFELNDGTRLPVTDVGNLVSAMAGFAGSQAGEDAGYVSEKADGFSSILTAGS